MNRPDPASWNSAVLATCVASLLLVLGFAYGTTFSRGCADAGATLGCIEFVLNRYQTLIGIFGALLAAVIAARPVWQQLGEMRAQSLRAELEFARKRSVELEQEKLLIYEITSSIDILANSLVTALSKRMQSGQLGINEVSLITSAEEHMNAMIERYARNLGPSWGSVDIQTKRSSVRDDAQRFSNRLREFTGRGLGPSRYITAAECDQLGNDLTPLKKIVWTNADLVHQAISEEIRRNAQRIERIESLLLA